MWYHSFSISWILYLCFFCAFVHYDVMISRHRDPTMFWFSNLKFLALWIQNSCLLFSALKRLQVIPTITNTNTFLPTISSLKHNVKKAIFQWIRGIIINSDTIALKYLPLWVVLNRSPTSTHLHLPSLTLIYFHSPPPASTYLSPTSTQLHPPFICLHPPSTCLPWPTSTSEFWDTESSRLSLLPYLLLCKGV